MKEEIPNDLVIKNLAGESTPEEDQWLWEWMAKDSRNQKIFNDAVKLYCNDGVLVSKHEIETRLEQVNLNPVRFPSVWWSVASVLLVSILTTLVISFDHRVIERTSFGEVKQVTLPDRSRVWLNGGSSIAYDEVTFEQTRKVFLDGEAYFEVSRSNSPFVIEYDSILASLDSGEVNIQNYPTELEKVAVVGEGIVTFRDLQKAELKIIASTEFEVLSRSDYGLLSRSINSNVNYKSWFTGVYVFNDEPIERVISVLGKANPRLKLDEGEVDRDRIVSGVFKVNDVRKSKEEIVRLIDNQTTNWE